MRPRVERTTQHPLAILGPQQCITPTPSPSPAGDEDLHSASELSEGMRIEHSRFGKGDITEIDAARPMCA